MQKFKRTILLLAGILVAVLLPQPARAQTDVLLVPAETTIRGDVATFNRPIVIAGHVTGDVTSWSGDITVNGTVSGDVISYGGAIRLGPAAQVTGSVLTLAGQVNSRDGAAIAGQLFGVAPNDGGSATLQAAFDTLPPLDDRLAGGAGLALSSLFTLGMVGLLGLLWPRRLSGVRQTLATQFGPATVLGLLTSLILAIGLPLGVTMLVISLIGLPLLAPILVLLQLPYVYGFAALAQLLGRQLLQEHQALGSLAATLLGTALLLLLPTALTIWSPLAGLATFYLLASPGLGAVIRSRAGAYVPSSMPAD